jgi:hypothetical protein
MKDVIIGGSSGYTWDTLKYWVNSINKSGFMGDIVLVMMNADKETVKKAIEAGVHVIGFGQNEQGDLVYQHGKIPVHVERFIHIYNYLKDKNYRFAITTDVKDVVFQQDPTVWLENNIGSNKLVFASESMRYKDEPWGNENLMQTFGPFIYEQFKDNEIFNVGVLAGRAVALKDLCMNIFLAAINRPIPICDQSTFNVMISMSPYLETSLYMRSEDAWAAQLGTTADPSKIDSFRPSLLEAEPKMINGKVTTSTGKTFTIVHQYDRVPEWRKVIEATYG